MHIGSSSEIDNILCIGGWAHLSQIKASFPLPSGCSCSFRHLQTILCLRLCLGGYDHLNHVPELLIPFCLKFLCLHHCFWVIVLSLSVIISGCYINLLELALLVPNRIEHASDVYLLLLVHQSSDVHLCLLLIWRILTSQI